MKHTTKFGIALTMLLGFTACQKVIQLELKDPSPILIVEAILTDQPTLGSNFVRLTKNTDYDALSAAALGVSGASITIVDNLGNRDSLFEVPANLIGGLRGFYGSLTMKGVVGRTYTLTILSEGKTYTAVSTMPAHHTAIDSLTTRRQQFGDPKDSVNRLVYVHFKDKPGVVENFRMQSSRQDTATKLPLPNVQYRLLSNNRLLPDAQYHNIPMFNLPFAKGETAIVTLWNMDAKVYDYFVTLQDATGNAFATPAAPSNPNTNIKGGAQGYFAAVSEGKDTILVK
jgi:hypothetical protein